MPAHFDTKASPTVKPDPMTPTTGVPPTLGEAAKFVPQAAQETPPAGDGHGVIPPSTPKSVGGGVTGAVSGGGGTAAAPPGSVPPLKGSSGAPLLV